MSIYTDNQKFYHVQKFNRSVPVPDLSGIEDFDLSFIQMRMILASRGWHTSFNVKKIEGEYLEISLTANHHHWKGTLSTVEIHISCTTCDLKMKSDARLLMRKLYALANAAILIDDFVPQYDGTKFVAHLNSALMNSYLNYPSVNVVVPGRSCPTEALPGWPGYISMREWLERTVNAEDYLDDIFETISLAAEQNFYQDKLTSAPGRPFQYKQRVWLYQVEIFPQNNRVRDLIVNQNKSVDDFMTCFTTTNLSLTAFRDVVRAALNNRGGMDLFE